MAFDVGPKLKAAREKLGLSRSHVAREADVDAAFLFRIENAQSKSPSFDSIGRIATVLGVSLDALVKTSKKPRR